ncbi:hypothetical protein U1Q18_006186 [Sarracenia purpurea var. burkii]
MASEEEAKGEMDSLFEGMVLFNPSQMADDDHHHVQQLQDQQQQQPQPVSPHTSRSPPSSDNSSSAEASSSESQPLDENLFSDLTLITPLQNQSTHQLQAQLRTSPTIAIDDTTTRSNSEVLPSSLSRQVSTRKKKRAGLRIGYGRDSAIPDDQHADGQSVESDLPPPSLSLQPESSRSTLQRPQQQEVSCCPTPPDSQTSPLSFPTAQPVSYTSPSTATTTAESDFTENTREVDPSHSTAANGALREYDNIVPEAEPTATVLSKDLQVGEDEVNTNAPIELRFEQIRAQISQKLGHVRELVASVSATRKDSTRRRRKAADRLNLASARFRELEKELEEACEAEDFETAERVSERLASAEKEKERLGIDLRHTETDCDAVDSKMQEVLEWQIAAEEESSSLLKTFAMDAENDALRVQKYAEVASQKELDRWLSLNEDLELKMMELDIESHLINAARDVLSDSIEHSVEDDRTERELLCKRKEILTQELVKLIALVKEKELEIAETDYNIETVEKRIADVVFSFQEVQSTVDTKCENLRSHLSQMELDTEALTRKKKEIDDFLSEERDRGAKLQELSQISANEANIYQEVVKLRKSLVLFILKTREDKVRLAETEDKLSEHVHILKQEISAARASLQELSSTKSSFQQEIETSKQRLAFIDKRVPELEAEKKVAAAARNFKEAARIAAESKALSVEKESLQRKMAEAILELGKLEKEICNMLDRLQETEGQITTKEKEVAMARFQRLLLIAGVAKAERSAALELGDLEEADILLAEAEAAEAEARKIQPVYNFKEEEFANLPRRYISMELVSNLGGQQLAELAASAYISV